MLGAKYGSVIHIVLILQAYKLQDCHSALHRSWDDPEASSFQNSLQRGPEKSLHEAGKVKPLQWEYQDVGCDISIQDICQRRAKDKEWNHPNT